MNKLLIILIPVVVIILMVGFLLAKPTNPTKVEVIKPKIVADARPDYFFYYPDNFTKVEDGTADGLTYLSYENTEGDIIRADTLPIGDVIGVASTDMCNLLANSYTKTMKEFFNKISNGTTTINLGEVKAVPGAGDIQKCLMSAQMPLSEGLGLVKMQMVWHNEGDNRNLYVLSTFYSENGTEQTTIDALNSSYDAFMLK